MPKKKFSREKKNFLMATWDDSKGSEDDSEEEHVHMALMASSEASDYGSESYHTQMRYSLILLILKLISLSLKFLKSFRVFRTDTRI